MTVHNNSLNVNNSTPLDPTIGGTGISNSHTLSITANSTINQDVTTTGAPTFASLAVTGNATANNFAAGTSPKVLIGGSTTLTNTDTQIIIFGGSGGTCILPDATTLVIGWLYYFHNNCSGNVVIEMNGGTTLLTMVPGSYLNLTAVTIAVPAGTWSYSWDVPQNVTWGTAGLVGYAKSGANSDITSLTGLTGVIQAPTQINDSSGNACVAFGYVASAVNYLGLSNNSTTNSPTVSSQGSDTNISLVLAAKNDAAVLVQTSAISAAPFSIRSGTSAQHQTNFVFSNTSNTRNVTFPDASFTIAQAGANSDITSLTGLNGIIQAPTFINDSSGNHQLGFSATASAVNYLQIANAGTGSAPTLYAKGSDTNVQLSLVAQAAAQVVMYSTLTSNQMAFVTGSGYQHTTTLNFPNSSSNKIITFQDASGTLAFAGANSDITSLTGLTTPLAVTEGGTGLGSTTANQILYSSATSTIAGLATANNSVLATNGSGVPSLTTSLPTAVQVGVNSLNSGTSASSTTFWRGDGTWSSVGTFFQSIVTLSAAQISAMSVTPIAIVPGVSSNIISLINISATLNFNSIAFTGGTDSVIQYNNTGADGGQTIVDGLDFFYSATSSTYSQFLFPGSSLFTVASVSGQGVYLTSQTPFLAGNSTATFYVQYLLTPA